MTYDVNKFFDLALDILCIAGVDGYFKRINAAFERTLGWSADELLGRPFIEFVHPDDVDRTVGEIGRLRSGIPTISFENRYRCADGSYRYLLWAAYPEQDTGLLYAVARDVTRTRRAEERFQVAIEASPAAMIMVDQQGLIQLVNREAERLFGYDSGELLGQSVELLMSESFRGKHAMHRETFLSEPQVRPMGVGRDLAASRRDGSEFPVEIGLNPLETREGTMVLASVIDLTARKEAEEAREKLIQELREALSEVKSLRGLIPICANCKKVRDDAGFWQNVESYVRARTEAEFSHSVCPECGPKLFGEFWEEDAE